MDHPTELHPNTPSILVVDDNPKNLQLMSAMLKQEGYKLYITNSGENALTFLENTLPDLILLDVMMPGLSGFEVCRIIRKQSRYQDIPVIFLTAKTEVEDIVQGFESGAVDYIAKPFHPQEVFVRVSNHLQLKRTRETLAEQNKKLAQLNQEKDRFFSIIAHDLRGPVSGLAGITELLYKETGNCRDENIKEMVELLHTTSVQVVDLLFNLLEWARIQMNAISFEPDNLQLKPVIDKSVRTFRNAVQDKNLTVSIDIDESILVFADVNQLGTILRNLISNAIKFTPSGGSVTLTAAHADPHQIRLTVADSGIGMGPELLTKLFRLDQKVSRPGTNGETSNGIGLLLCHDLVKRQGGQLSVESSEGVGTTFSFTLPSKRELS